LIYGGCFEENLTGSKTKWLKVKLPIEENKLINMVEYDFTCRELYSLYGILGETRRMITGSRSCCGSAGLG
jgi:hypothetical protein